MAFEPSYNILDKDTHNMVVEAFKSGGIGYTEADGTVHKISDTYASGGGGGKTPLFTVAVTIDSGMPKLSMTPAEMAEYGELGYAILDTSAAGGQDGVLFRFAILRDGGGNPDGVTFRTPYEDALEHAEPYNDDGTTVLRAGGVYFSFDETGTMVGGGEYEYTMPYAQSAQG